jgi:hypothetical protein
MNVSLRRLLEIFALLLVIIATPLAWHFARGDYVRKEWLIERITVAEAEARDGLPLDYQRTKLDSERGKPFGSKNEEWESLKRQMQPDDELWTWGSPWPGAGGMALVRNGRVAASFWTWIH